MKKLLMSGLVVALAGCGSAAGSLAPGALGVSARDAYVEARSVARSWSPDARLRWLAGEDIGTDGVALPEAGGWSFHYTAPNRTRELVVTVTSLSSASEERPVTSPPGFVIGDNALGTDWIDSREVLEAIRSETDGIAAPVDMLLVPIRPEQWLVEGEAGPRWRVRAETGEVLAR